ncbi:class I SAM-dependent methyltransferase [Atlantibacter sp.]|uniref:class I SAM-dependent methyltransferase n=1 Tax=Atlantibacter sp. TaxID=1903473 RepID=UPI0028AF676C|nr:class I SAM-dependent methyltransferase [Atlantibacter sp.]
MENNSGKSINWFERGGDNYARYRPDYPKELVDYLAGLAPHRDRALDVGCGNGQLTQRLADAFDTVVGVDPSASQIANVTPHPRIHYQCGPAETLPDNFAPFSLITVAQAVHWFKLEDFYREARRVAAPDAILALICYGIMEFEEPLNERFRQFYDHEIGAWWPPERRLVDEGYRTLDFPFDEIAPLPLQLETEWDFSAFCGYISTWSAVTKVREAGQEHLVERFFEEFQILWGDEAKIRKIVWPVAMRIGHLK